jgi:hypothetical protein
MLKVPALVYTTGNAKLNTEIISGSSLISILGFCDDFLALSFYPVSLLIAFIRTEKNGVFPKGKLNYLRFMAVKTSMDEVEGITLLHIHITKAS